VVSFLQAKLSERLSLQEFKDYLYLAIKTLLEDFKSKSEIMVRWWANAVEICVCNYKGTCKKI